MPETAFLTSSPNYVFLFILASKIVSNMLGYAYENFNLNTLETFD